MQKFKTYFLFLFLASVCISCVPTESPSVVPDSSSSAMFTVNEVKGHLSISKQSALPKTFTLKLHTCILSRMRNQPLPFTDYAITHNKKNFAEHKKSGKSFTDILRSSNLKTTTGKEIIRIRTDGKGCLNWTEEFDYAYYNQSRWIITDRYIQGLSNSWPGITANIPIAINPWLQLDRYKHLQVVDYREKFGYTNDSTLQSTIVPNGTLFLKEQKKQEKQNKVHIIIDKLNFFMHSQQSSKKKRLLTAHIQAKVNYTIKDILGGETDNPINTGDFVIRPILLVETKIKQTKDSKKTYVIMNEEGQKLQVKTKFRNNYMVSDTFTWTVPFESYISAIDLYVEITPIHKTANRINPFEGIYSFGATFKNILKNQQELKLHSDLAERHHIKIMNLPAVERNTPAAPGSGNCLKTMPLHSKVIYCIVNNNKLNENLNSFGPGGWTLDPLTIEYFGLKKENWLSRKIITRIQTVINDPLLTTKIDRSHIKIEVTDMTTGEKTKITDKRTQSNGQIIFTVPSYQHWYKKQRYFLKMIHFYTDSGELNITKLIAINPWDYGFTHGFEVNQTDNIRTTCLQKHDAEELVRTFFPKPKNKNEDVTPKQLDFVHKTVCHLAGAEKINKPIQTWAGIIAQYFKSVFGSPGQNTKKSTNNTNTGNTKNLLAKRIQAFIKKFTSVEDIPAARSYVHLFRSINKYPTILIDPSLNRSLFYNVRVKITPRIVRMDSILKGQQDKGPLRDGVYVLQMALLKNDQERRYGSEASALRQSEYRLINPDGRISHTDTLYTCKTNTLSKQCITKEDFIIPPVNIPVITRDGTIRTDINIPIARKNLLFANSKNLLVFRVLPADPKSMHCKDGTIGLACSNNKDFDWGYDWQQSIPHIRPADKKYYDILFYTYKTPFIPSLWNNWNITRETDMQFSDLAELFKQLPASAELSSEYKTGNRKDAAIPSDSENIPLQNRQKMNRQDVIQTDLFATAKKDNQKNPGRVCPHISLGESTYSLQDKNCRCIPSTMNGRLQESAECRTQRIEVENRDLSEAHISHFAGSHALCVLPVGSSVSTSKTCGSETLSTEEKTQAFLKNLNHQIRILNQSISNIRNPYWPDASSGSMDIKKSLAYEHRFSHSFRDKLSRLPMLPTLRTTDLEAIIQSGIHNDNLDLKKAAFIHALCGFWFDKFYSPAYTNTELLKDALKKTVQNTFYYKLRGINPLPGGMTSLDENISNQDINKAMQTLQTEYTKHLREINLKGYIDDMHNWVNQ